MISAAISRVKAHLSELLDRVKGGEEILITDHGRPVAKVIGLSPDSDADLAALERAGLVRIGRGRISRKFWTQPRPQDPEGAALRALLEEREGGR